VHPDDFSAEPVKRRIERGVIVAGVLVAVVAGYFDSALAAGAVALGAGLAWLNFRWLMQGLDAIEQVSRAREGATGSRIPVGVLARFFARFALLLVVLYVSLAYSLLPAWALLAGVFTLVASIIGESVYQVASRGRATR
jgi:hypothetical protein